MRLNKIDVKKLLAKHGLFTAILIIFWGALLITHGLIPGTVGGQTTYQSTVGIIECGARQPANIIRARCSLMGGNSESVIPQELPFVLLATIFSVIFFIPPIASYYLVAALTMLVALFFGYKFFSLEAKNRYIALFGIVIYLFSPFILGLRNFGGTYWAFLLIPAILYYSWKLINFKKHSINQHLYQNLVMLTLLWAIWATFLIFLDGYAFIMCSVAVLMLHAVLISRDAKLGIKELVLRGIVFLGGFLVASFLYKIIIPIGSFGKSPIYLFRAMGLDLATLYFPTKNTLLAYFSHINFNWSHLWGDGSNTSNYLGFILFGVFIAGVIYAFRHKEVKIVNLKLAILGVLLAGLVLSLGPSLKIDSKIGTSETSLSDRYMMKPQNAIVSLPTAILFRYAPGFSSTRATYRWFVLTEVGVIFYAIYFLDSINKRRWKYLVLVTGLIIFLDIVPTPGPTLNANLVRAEQINQFNSEVISDMKVSIKKDDTVIFYPNTSGGNDFLADYIAPAVGLKTYNIGGDKAVNIARERWPNEIRQLLTGNLQKDQDLQLIQVIFKKKYITALIVPEFDLRWDSYKWPPTTKYHDTKRIIESLKKSGFQVEQYKRFEVIRIKN